MQEVLAHLANSSYVEARPVTRPFAALPAIVLSLLLAVTPAGAQESPPEHPEWAPISSATIRPGVEADGCTTNFVFYERHVGADGSVRFDVFIGLAAHCFSLGNNTQTNGCTTPTQPLGSRVSVDGASQEATLVYSSWVTMQEVDEADAGACAGNDFAIVKLDPADHASVNPTILYFGGPDGLRTARMVDGEDVFSYGNSSLRLGISQLSPKRGISMGTNNTGWSHTVLTLTPGIPGDSGSAFVDETGRAFGVVVTLSVTGSNGVTDMNKALEYMRSKTGQSVQLALGTQSFEDPVLP